MRWAAAQRLPPLKNECYYTRAGEVPPQLWHKKEGQFVSTRVVFLGTPDFAVPSLKALAASDAFEVVGVVTQPDRPAGRGQSMRPPAVKEAALALDIPITQPSTLRDEEAVAQLRAWGPDVLVVAAFGQILRRPVLELAPYGCVNVHASLLPRWRGAAPIHYAIRAGDKETGVTIMKMDDGLDTGPILARRAIPIFPRDTAATLHDRLAELGAQLLPGVLEQYVDGDITPQPQPEEGVTHAPTLDKDEGRIDWAASAAAVDRHVRAFDPWPGTFTFLDGKRIKIVGGTPLPDEDADEAPGTLVAHDDGLAVQTGEGLYALDVIQPAGKGRMTGEAYLAGHRDVIGRQFAAG
jgi:methionyl-tRNA formyltransferase